MTVVFVSDLGGPSRLVADLEVNTSVLWRIPDADGGTTVPIAGWYLMSAEQLTHPQNMYFRIVKPHSWPFADVALFFVPEHVSVR